MPKLDNVLRQWTAEEIPELDVKVLKAKISALEGTSLVLPFPAGLDLTVRPQNAFRDPTSTSRSEEHTSELQSQ